MYYPFFRGKQFELRLLRDNTVFLEGNNIHPIIEPVKKDFAPLKRTMKTLCNNNVSFTLVVNPQTGENPVDYDELCSELIDKELKNYESISLGYMLDAEATLKNLLTFLEKYERKAITIIHCGFQDSKLLADSLDDIKNIKRHVFIDGFAQKLYQRNLKKPGIERILIRNGFKPQKKNAHFPDSEHFSDLHITYPDEGMDGFGDYSIVGDGYSETGGPAYAVAIHLTYLQKDDDMFIYHFISDQTDSPVDPGGKFLEALNKLVKEISSPKTLIYSSSACKEYLALHREKHYPGLGYVKKLSMQHHLELVADYLKRSA